MTQLLIIHSSPGLGGVDEVKVFPLISNYGQPIVLELRVHLRKAFSADEVARGQNATRRRRGSINMLSESFLEKIKTKVCSRCQRVIRIL